VGEEIVNVPAEFLLLPQVTLYPLPQATTSAADIEVVASREEKYASPSHPEMPGVLHSQEQNVTSFVFHGLHYYIQGNPKVKEEK
jgi:hypothetical protein